MYEHKEKSAVGTAIPATEKISVNNSNIVQTAEKSKPLTVSQIITIVNTFISSEDAFQLVDKLSKLEFCSLETAADVLVKRGYITAEDKEYILGTNIEIRRTKNVGNYRE